MNDMHGLIFGFGMHDLRELTTHRTVASVPFAARYRVIDFILSSMTNAGISDIGIILRDKYQSMLDHLGSGKDWDLSRNHGGLKLLPPFALYRGERRREEFRGIMDALVSVRSYIVNIAQEYVVLADGDTIASLDIKDVLAKHIDSGADITAVTYYSDSADKSGIRMKTDSEGWLLDTLLGSSNENVSRSLGVYILRNSLLLELMDICEEHEEYSFTAGALRQRKRSLKIMTYNFDGFAVKPFSVQSYYTYSMRLLAPEVRASLFNKERPIYTKLRDEPPTYYAPGSVIRNSLVADGCYIEGEIENSIIFRGVKIAKGAKVSNSIVMQSSVIGRDSRLDGVIADKNVVVHSNRSLVSHPSYPMIIGKDTIV